MGKRGKRGGMGEPSGVTQFIRGAGYVLYLAGPKAGALAWPMVAMIGAAMAMGAALYYAAVGTGYPARLALAIMATLLLAGIAGVLAGVIAGGRWGAQWRQVARHYQNAFERVAIAYRDEAMTWGAGDPTDQAGAFVAPYTVSQRSAAEDYVAYCARAFADSLDAGEEGALDAESKEALDRLRASLRELRVLREALDGVDSDGWDNTRAYARVRAHKVALAAVDFIHAVDEPGAAISGREERAMDALRDAVDEYAGPLEEDGALVLSDTDAIDAAHRLMSPA